MRLIPRKAVKPLSWIAWGAIGGLLAALITDAILPASAGIGSVIVVFLLTGIIYVIISWAAVKLINMWHALSHP